MTRVDALDSSRPQSDSCGCTDRAEEEPTTMNSTDTNTATSQAAAVAAPGPHVAPAKTTPTRKATARKAAPKAAAPDATSKAKKAGKSAKAKPAAKPNKKAAAPPASKKSTVIAMMKAKGGATLDAIIAETGWAKHTIRGLRIDGREDLQHHVGEDGRGTALLDREVGFEQQHRRRPLGWRQGSGS